MSFTTCSNDHHLVHDAFWEGWIVFLVGWWWRGSAGLHPKPTQNFSLVQQALLQNAINDAQIPSDSIITFRYALDNQEAGLVSTLWLSKCLQNLHRLMHLGNRFLLQGNASNNPPFQSSSLIESWIWELT